MAKGRKKFQFLERAACIFALILKINFIFKADVVPMSTTALNTSNFLNIFVIIIKSSRRSYVMQVFK